MLDNNADLANSGTCFVMLKQFSDRLKAKDQDLLSIFRALQKGLASMQDGRAIVLPPPAIQGIGNSGGFTMQVELRDGSNDFAKLQTLTKEFPMSAKA